MRRRDRRSWLPSEWQTLTDWLYGVDLFNQFYFWEAHEAWESLWATAPRDSDQRLLLQGLIQIAAALLKVHGAVLAGAQSLSHDGMEKLARVAATHPCLLGLDVVDAERRWRRYFEPLARRQLPAIDADVPLLLLQSSSSSTRE